MSGGDELFAFFLSHLFSGGRRWQSKAQQKFFAFVRLIFTHPPNLERKPFDQQTEIVYTLAEFADILSVTSCCFALNDEIPKT